MKRDSIRITIFFIVAFFALSSTSLPADDLQTGSQLMLYNKPQDAAPYLEKALRADPTNAQIYMYLGLVYEQLQQFDKAISYYRSALDRNIGDSTVICNNIANNYAKKNDDDNALKYYTMALSSNPDYLPAVLAKGNAEVRKKSFADAIPDYQHFLAVDPKNPLSPDVSRMIAALQDELNAQVAQAKQAEADRVAAVQKQADDAAKQAAADAQRKKLLDDVFSSLSDAGTQIDNSSAGSEAPKNSTDDLSREE